MSLETPDLDGDGDSDILFSDRTGPRSGAYWLENPGAQHNRRQAPWEEHTVGATGREAMFLDLGDVNGDGCLDVVVAAKPRDVLVFYQQPKGGWRETKLTLADKNLGDAKAVKIADLNGDGRADLVFTCEHADQDRTGAIWLEQQTRGQWLQRPLGGTAGVKFDLIQILDLDHDGDLDVITCEERDQLGVIWYENPLR